jgi:hypothetical protein
VLEHRGFPEIKRLQAYRTGAGNSTKRGKRLLPFWSLLMVT